MMLDMADIRRRHEETCATEDSKDKIIADLFSHVESLHDKLCNESDAVNDQRRLTDSFREESRKYKSDLDNMRRDQAKLSFVSVLVDGDGMNFHEKLVQDGQNGGYEAARLLIQSVDEHVQDVVPGVLPRYRILVYANVKGLAKAYRSADVLNADEDLTEFIQGFNKADPLCYMVDAGNGKECTDVKLRHQFEQDIVNVHCCRIIFCASADDSHARVLGPCRDPKCISRISLVKGPPFAHEMQQLAENFTTLSFEAVFMSSKLNPTRRVSFGATRAITPSQTAPNTNYASAARSAPLRSSSPAANVQANGSTKPKLSVCLNARSQRVDRPIKYSSRENVDALKREKLCNQFHILGKCSFGGNCTHKHDPELSPLEIVDLTHIARLSPCPNDLFCREVNCIYGHRCPRESCYGHCKFSGSMHGVDTTIVDTI